MDFSRKTILVIDDTTASMTFMSHILGRAGYSNVLAADSASQALAILTRLQEENGGNGTTVDLILLDLATAERAGITTCSKLKAAPQAMDVPLVMVAADSNDANLQKAFEQGALDFVSKPLTQVELLARVKTALVLKEERDMRIALAKELAEAIKKVQRAALTDSLTGIANRRYFDEFLEQEWRRCRREQQSITLCLGDIDFFKAYNTGYGHRQGDECLKKIAAILLTIVKRPGDLVARYSGKKFAIILSGTSEVGGYAVAKRVMAAVAARNVPHEHSAISDRITLSFGIAMLVPKAATAVHDLLAQADHALYQAKKMGRNQINGPGLQDPHPR